MNNCSLKIKRISSVFWLVFLVLFIEVVQPNKAISIEATSVQILFNEALQQSKEGNFADALKSWDKFLEISPDDVAAISNRGNCLLEMGDPQSAIVAQSRAIQLSDSPDAYLNRGIANEALQKWDEASKDYNSVLAKNPGNPSALYNLGNVKGSQDQWPMAKVLFTRASRENSGFVIARSSQALAEYQLGEFDHVEEALRNLIRKYPMFADSRAALTALLWKKGLNGEAESHWAAVLGLDSRYKDEDWLINIRRWPPNPTKDLMSFIDLQEL
tara:strand:- start:3756 stop:4571 length:816 start_codon:yes stop_codon:yes gene_type:complete